MKLNEFNLKHTGSFCPTCKQSDYSLFDEHRGETFCAKCGMVLHESNNRKSVVEYMRTAGNPKRKVSGLKRSARH